MRISGAAVLVLAAISAAILLTTPASVVSADAVRVFYQDVQGIHVDFPNGRAIEDGRELIIVTSSYIYDMERSGIMFYEHGSDGKADLTTSVTPDHYSVSEGNVVTHVFVNLTKDIDMHFTELKRLESGAVTEGDQNHEHVAFTEPTTILMLISTALAAVMLVVITRISRKIGSASEGPDGSP